MRIVVRVISNEGLELDTHNQESMIYNRIPSQAQDPMLFES